MQRGVQRAALRRCHAAGKVPLHISAMHSGSPRIRADLEMTDALGWRMKFGVIAPSTNTVVQPEFDLMRPRGVTNHFARIHIPNAPILGDADFEKLIAAVRGELLAAVDRVMTCEPGHLIMGMSSETFWDGLEGSERLRERIEARAGVAVTMGSDAAPSCSSRESPSPKSSCSASLTPFAAGGKKQNGMHDFQRVDERSGRTASDKSFCAIGYSQKPQSQAAAVLVCQVGRLRDFPTR